MRKEIIFSIFAVIFMIGCSNEATTATTEKSVSTEKRVVEVEEDNKIKLSNLDGSTVEATMNGESRIKDFTFSNAKDQGVVIAYWSTTCPPCIAEIPHLVKLEEKYKGKVKILGVLVEDKTKEEIKQFVEYHGINYEITIGDANYELADAMGGVRGIPAMFMFKKDGTLHKNFVGLIPPEMLDAEMKKLI